jgi:hydrogen peroxide-dependent heme synthase
MSALPPATVEGWYSLHQAFDVDYSRLRELPIEERSAVAEAARAFFTEIALPPTEDGWSGSWRIAGGGADVLLVHFRASIDELSEIEAKLKRSRLGDFLTLRYDYLAVTEAGLYHATAEVAKQHEPHSREYKEALAAEAEAEAASPHVKTRLFPRPPEEMRYLSFYPMSKRRTHGDNWYSLDVGERNRLMREHGLTGRRYAGRIFQVICGSVGLDDWEWGVTLFAKDPLEFKRIVTEMRYDEASARYGEFGRFFTGVRLAPEEWPDLLRVE